MTDFSKYFPINNREIKWGTTLSQVCCTISGLICCDLYSEYGATIQLRGSSVFGLKTILCTMRSPFEDRPVLQVQYEIQQLKVEATHKRHLPYLYELISILGEPLSQEKMYDREDFNPGYEWSIVVYCAQWKYGNVIITLSVYGGCRNIEGIGTSGAGLFFDWEDEIEAAKIYRKRNELQLKKYLQEVDLSFINKFKLDDKQRPFFKANYRNPNPFEAEQNRNLRAAQLALYKKELFVTPKKIASRINADEIAYIKTMRGDGLLISTKWDSVFINCYESKKLIFWNIKPSRGTGYKEFLLKGLRLMDSKESNNINNLIKSIEKDLDINIECKIRYDE